MNAASRLLATTSMSISDIAGQAGFTTLEHFSNTFKKYYNTTPTQFRSSTRK
jgi:AraC-like DNA-binding protein